LEDEKLVERSARLGKKFLEDLKSIQHPFIKEVRGRGLFIGVEIDPNKAQARTICERLMHKGLLSKETHHTVVRLAPPLVIDPDELSWAVDQLKNVLEELQ
jgi:ornithine--oxo-acid transaminase